MRPWDLSEAAGTLWARLGAVWTKRRRVAWADLEIGASGVARRLVTFAQEYGMGIGLQAPPAARRLLALAAARDSFHQAQTAAVTALEAAKEALSGV